MEGKFRSWLLGDKYHLKYPIKLFSHYLGKNTIAKLSFISGKLSSIPNQ